MKLVNALLMIAVVSVCTIIQGARAEVWSATNIRGASPAMSADGRVFVAAGPSTLVSYDYGATWRTNNFQGTVAAISANGSNIIVIGNSPAAIYSSSDAGATWASSPSPAAFSPRHIACSSDGIRAGVVLYGSDPIFISTNGAVSWSTNNDAPITFWTGIASSAEGSRLVACSQNQGLWLSTNYGLNWSSILASNNLTGVACSADGKTLVASSGMDVVYVSRDFGATWSWQNVSTNGGSGAACSADGTRLAAVSYFGVFLSTNSGVTWAGENMFGLAIDGIAMSADGHRLMAHSGGLNRLFLGTSTPTPILGVVPTNATLSISWTVPSAPFVLQQSTALNPANWTAYPDEPTLSPATLRNEITIPATNNRAFLRLLSP